MLSGSPSPEVGTGQAYRFMPSGSDADGDALTYRIENAPPWASFDTASGELTGTPSAADVGVYSGIRIGVSDGTATTWLPAFGVTVVAIGSGSATLSWLPPTQREDGSALVDLAGFKVYWGPDVGDYPNSVILHNPGLSSYVVEPLTAGTWYFVTTAFDSRGTESDHSNVASKSVR